MNAYLIAATALVAAIAPPAVVCARGRPIEGAVALQLCTTTTTVALLCLCAGFHRAVYFNIAVIAAALSGVNALVTARMLGHRI